MKHVIKTTLIAAILFTVALTKATNLAKRDNFLQIIAMSNMPRGMQQEQIEEFEREWNDILFKADMYCIEHPDGRVNIVPR